MAIQVNTQASVIGQAALGSGGVLASLAALSTPVGQGAIEVGNRQKVARVSISLAAGSTLALRCTEGATTKDCDLVGAALTAGQLYVVEPLPLGPGAATRTYDLVLGTDVAIDYINVEVQVGEYIR